MTVEQVARDHYAARQALSAAAVRESLRRFRRLDLADLDGSWNAQARALLRIITAAQFTAASTADSYLDDVLTEQDIDPGGPRVRPEAFAGIASDGRQLDTLAYQPVIQVKTRIGHGETPFEALEKASKTFGVIVATQVADAGRVADGVATTARRQATGYYRQLSPPSCSRCAVLAGRWYRWSSGFLRHPRCDCIHTPGTRGTAEGVRTDPKRYFDSLDAAEQDRIFTNAGAQAIRDGADIGQVVNARRGMDVAGSLTTREAARGRARLTPEGVYEIARDREEAVGLLRRNGYLA